jgi:hypothetical protein
MAQPGDAISVSPDEIQVRTRSIASRRAEFPAPAAVARTEGPAGGASHEFRAELARAARQLAVTVDTIARELADLERDMEAAGSAFVEADQAVAKDVDSLGWMLESADRAAGPGQPTTPPPTAPPATAPPAPAPPATTSAPGGSDPNADLG